MKKLLIAVLLTSSPLLVHAAAMDETVAQRVAPETSMVNAASKKAKTELANVDFNNLKILYKLSELHWFIKKHALSDVKRGGGELMPVDNATFDTLKLLYQLSSLQWFIEKSALRDAKQANDKASLPLLMSLQGDLIDLIAELKEDQNEGEYATEETLADIKQVLQKHIALFRPTIIA